MFLISDLGSFEVLDFSEWIWSPQRDLSRTKNTVKRQNELDSKDFGKRLQKLLASFSVESGGVENQRRLQTRLSNKGPK